MALLPGRRDAAARIDDTSRRYRLHAIGTRQNNTTKTKVGIIIAVIAGVLLCGGLCLFYLTKWIRARHSNPKYLPGSWLKRKWRSWNPRTNATYSGALQDGRSFENLRATTPASSRSGAASARGVGLATENADEGVDRHTSVRSVMTLPAYSSDVRPTEKVIGREGERAGIDMVVEYPESEGEAESRREETMESLYQIRVARREEVAQRAARRQARREARERGDESALAALALESRQRAEAVQSPADALIAEHQARGRDRRVSSVSYAELGVARHDGSRVRANSRDSDNHPLLDSAASMGGTDGRLSTNALSTHTRDRSASSFRSMSPAFLPEEDDEESGNDQATDGRMMNIDLDVQGSQSTSHPTPGSSDLGDGRLPQIEPPRYEPPPRSSQDPRGEAPPYESPSTTGAPRLPVSHRYHLSRLYPRRL